MQNITKIFIGILFLAGIVFLAPVYVARAAGPNLAPNPGLETANSSGTAPLNWQTDNWGNNTAALTYESTGHNSAHSVKVQMSAHKSGDAKWFFNPVSVNPNADYTFSDYYMSSVQTSIVAESLDAQGNATFFDVATAVAVSPTAWKNVSYTLHTPANAQSLTIFHLIKKNGWLQIDDVNLSAVTPTPITDYVPNNSMEIVSPTNANLPDQWSHSKWGTNTPVYEYATDGHDGSRSVKLTMTNYTSGDAKWVYTPQVLPQGDYRFTAWYKTNAIPHVVADYVENNGTENFFGLSDPEPSGTGWQQYSGIFPVPSGVKAVSVFFFLSNNGWVQTDDYHILPYTYAGFDQPRVTLTFDNGFENNISTVLPVLDQYGMKVTYCYSTEYVESLPAEVAIAQTFASHGNETCSHAVHHADMTLDTVTQMDYELFHSQSYLESITGQPVTDFLTPFGAYNSTVVGEIEKYYNAHRTTDEGFNSKDTFDPYRLKVQNMQLTTTMAQFQGWVNKVKADKTWLILVYHVVDVPGGLTQFDTYKTDFDAQMKWLAAAGVPVERMDQALTEIKPQVP